MRTRLPLIIGSVMVVLTVLTFFSPGLNDLYGKPVNQGLFIFQVFAIIPATIGLIRLHILRTMRRPADALYSGVALVAFFATLILGLLDRKFNGTYFAWINGNVFSPLQKSVFAFLAFFIASAAYRAFRARTLEATVLLIAGIVVLIGNAIFPLWGPGMPAEMWFLSVPGMAMQRGVILGVALGIIAQSVRILLGLERGFVGRG